MVHKGFFVPKKFITSLRRALKKAKLKTICYVVYPNINLAELALKPPTPEEWKADLKRRGLTEEGTRTGRFSGKKPNKTNRPKVMKPILDKVGVPIWRPNTVMYDHDFVRKYLSEWPEEKLPKRKRKKR